MVPRPGGADPVLMSSVNLGSRKMEETHFLVFLLLSTARNQSIMYKTNIKGTEGGGWGPQIWELPWA